MAKRLTPPRVAPEDKAFVAQLLLYLDDALDAAGVADLKRDLERNESRRELYVAMCTQRWAIRESLLRCSAVDEPAEVIAHPATTVRTVWHTPFLAVTGVAAALLITVTTGWLTFTGPSSNGTGDALLTGPRADAVVLYDVNNDKTVDAEDFLAVEARWGTSSDFAAGDFDGDVAVTLADMAILQRAVR